MASKIYYLAEHTDEDIHSRTFGQRVLRRVSAEGFDKGLEVRHWLRVVASDMTEARAKFQRGEGVWFS